MKTIQLGGALWLTIGMLTTTSAASAQTSAQKSTPDDLIDALHAAFGKHPARAVHSKGIILKGTFTPDPGAASLSKAFHFQKTGSKVTLRFSNFTGIPNIPDNIGAANPRGMAVKFTMPDGTNTDVVGHSFDGFPTENSDQFRELLMAISTSGPDAARPSALDKFLDTHPVAKTFLTTQNTPASYASINYFGVNAFKFTNQRGESVFGRYQFIPVDGEKFLSADQLKTMSEDYLQADIKKRVSKGTFKFKMYAQIAEAGDKIDDPSVAWSSARRRVLLGVIEIKELASNFPEEDKALFFIPNNVPNGIAPADPMINFRSRAYPISVTERQQAKPN